MSGGSAGGGLAFGRPGFLLVYGFRPRPRAAGASGNRVVKPVPFSRWRTGRGSRSVLPGLLALCFVFAGEVRGQDPVVPPPAIPADPAYLPPANSRELLAVDAAMREFFAARVDAGRAVDERLGQIVKAILRPDGLAFAYESAGTYDARETFRRRRGNCQAFSFLVVAVAREQGLPVRFQDITTYHRWNRYDRFIATVRHTNVRMSTADAEYIVDLRPDLGHAGFASDRYVVDDARTFAHFYSTAGFFRLVAGDCSGALQLMKRGAEEDPTSPLVWTNLGNLHVQLDEPAAARECFERALRLDARMEEALAGLVKVLRRMGGPAELRLASKYERRVQAYRERNPYYIHHLAREARLRGELEATERHLRRAIRLKDDEPFFHEDLIALLRQAGREKEAVRAEARLAKLRVRLARVETFIMP